MNNKEEEILKIITNYIKENEIMPSLRYIQKELNYKSVNSIRQYFISLEKKGYLIRNNNKLIINNNNIYNNNLKRIKIINLKNKYIEIVLNKKNNYIAFKMNNNYFNRVGIFKNDILIIKITKKITNNELGLFIIDNKPRIMTYNYKDGFYILKDNNEIILNKIKLLGKMVLLVRKI